MIIFPKIIGLTGLAQSGKSTISNYLVANYGYKRVRFAEGLKNMLKVIGLTEAHVDGDQKEVPLKLFGGNTARRAMQTLGTEWGRSLCQDIWVNIWEQAILKYLENNENNKVVVDDVRFPNELERVVKLGGKVIRVIRIGQVSTSTHPSETALNNIELPTIIAESGDMDKLYKGIDEIIGGR